MKTRNIPKQFDSVVDLGFKNLLVGGCSFTYNNSDIYPCTWPYYLRDLGNFEEVFDCSFMGGGNQHIVNSIIYTIDKHEINPADTLIMILWAGNDRDDYVIDQTHLNHYPYVYSFEPGVVAGITGGEGISNLGNSKIDSIIEIKQAKSQRARAVENYVRVSALFHFLRARGFDFVFMEYRDFDLPARDLNFDPRTYLPTNLSERFDTMISKPWENFHKYCLYHNLMQDDDFHPSSDGHFKYTKEVLLPWLSKKFAKE